MVGYADEATVQTDSTGRKLNYGWWPVPYKPGKWINDSVNCYACISSSIKTVNPKNGEMRYWRGEASFGHGLALMVDDIGSGAGSKGAMSVEDLSAILPPTAVVETSPGNFQVWYFLDEPEPDMDWFKAFLISFVDAVLKERGGDFTIRDVSRYGRMPTGINNKRNADGSLKYPAEFRVRLVSADYTRRYSPRAISDAFGFVIRKQVWEKKFEKAFDGGSAEEEAHKRNLYWLNLAVQILSNSKMGEGSGGKVQLNMSGKYRIKCPWGEEHQNSDTYGAYFRGPIPGAEHEFVFGCSHDTCRKLHKRTWSTFVDKIVMPWIIAQVEQSYSNPIILPPEIIDGPQ